MSGKNVEKAGVYVDVIIPIPVPNLFTYKVPELLVPEVIPGKRVVVPFGKQKLQSGLVRKVHNFSGQMDIKEIISVLDEKILVNQRQFEFWDWISSYYMCYPGEVMNAALPSALKLQSETLVRLNPAFDPETCELSQDEYLVLDMLKESEELSLEDLNRVLKKKSVHPLLNSMLHKEAILLSEEIEESYRPKLQSRITLSGSFEDEKALEVLFQQMEQDKRKKRQLDTLMIFLKHLYASDKPDHVLKSELIKDRDFSASSLQSLIKNGVLVETMVRIDRIDSGVTELNELKRLSEAQEKAMAGIKEKWQSHDSVCLHGVTSSGKTEIYIHLIDEALRSGKQVLYLLPEIALTTQIIARLRRYFGKAVGVFHSRYSNNERVEIWNNVLSYRENEKTRSKGQLILGARSALFLPFSNIGLIVVDEEHDTSYKQADPSPRYHARDAALMLARIHSAKVLLGSATPSLETYHNAVEGRSGLVKLNERYGGVLMPQIIVADTGEAARKKLMKSHFTPQLINAIQLALERKEQVILFQNRRGFSPYLECKRCAWIPHCRNCSVTLTYHKAGNILRCHYCGFVQAVPSVCGQCGDHHVEVRGFGTEKIEEEISILFPECKTGRMDLDVTRTKNSIQRIINDFEEKKIDILVGTQMVTKGLDFDNVSTVGIVNADQLMNFPDFRAFERSFQLMEQVSGRSGRKNKQGVVIIQTRQPDHWVIGDVVRHDYESFYQRDLNERRKFNYPPLSRLIEVILKHKNNFLLADAAGHFGVLLRQKLGHRVFGPHVPLVFRIKNQYLNQFLIKIEKDGSPAQVKALIRDAIRLFYTNRDYARIQLQLDVDPV